MLLEYLQADVAMPRRHLCLCARQSDAKRIEQDAAPRKTPSMTVPHVLAIQDGTMGHATCGETLRQCFERSGQVRYQAHWSLEAKTAMTKTLSRLVHLRLPLVTGADLDFERRRPRVEWIEAQSVRKLVETKLRTQSFDALHFHTQAGALGSTAVMRSVPTVVSIDRTSFQMTGHTRATMERNIVKEREVFRLASHVVAWSDWAGQSLIRDHGIGAEKVSVIPPGVRFWELDLAEIEARAMRRILFIGTDFSRKGGWDLLEVFHEHFDERVELHLVTPHAIDDPGRNVVVHRGVPAYSAQWKQLLAEADVFVLPSYAEEFGLVLQEAAAFGAALVGTRIGGIPQMIREGENGFLIEPGDKGALGEGLRRLVEEDDLRLRFRRRSRELALAEFDAERNARRLGEVFGSVGR